MGGKASQAWCGAWQGEGPFKCLAVLVFVGPDARDILTSHPAIRGSVNIARTVEGMHPADDKTEALMIENVARPKDTRALDTKWLPFHSLPAQLTVSSLSGIRQVVAP